MGFLPERTLQLGQFSGLGKGLWVYFLACIAPQLSSDDLMVPSTYPSPLDGCVGRRPGAEEPCAATWSYPAAW